MNSRTLDSNNFFFDVLIFFRIFSKNSSQNKLHNILMHDSTCSAVFLYIIPSFYAGLNCNTSSFNVGLNCDAASLNMKMNCSVRPLVPFFLGLN